jgi:dipeptidyl aminopeptidase/acylaminoacyl peptidase
VHGERDDAVPIGEDRGIVEAIRACGGDITLTVYPEAGHDVWTRTYEDPAFWSWLLAQRRARRAP